MKKIIHKICCLSLVFLIISCVQDLDFEQSKDFESKPVYTATLMYFNMNQTSFVFQNIEIVEVADTLAFSLLNNNIMQKQLEKVVILFKVDNQFKRDFKIEFSFLNSNDEIVQNVDPLEIPGNVTNYEQRFTINLANSPEFLTSTKLKVSIQLKPSNDGSIIDVTDQKVLSFKSGADFYLKIE